MTAYEKRNLFDRYKQDALFRQWLPTLGVLSRAGHGGEVEVWHEVERMLRLLGREPEWREAEVEFLYTELCERYPSAPVFRAGSWRFSLPAWPMPLPPPTVYTRIRTLRCVWPSAP